MDEAAIFGRAFGHWALTGRRLAKQNAGVGRYHFRLNNGINVVPFSGIGLLHVDVGRIDRSDTSWYIPIGVSLEYQAAHNLALSSTLIVNLHDINLSPSISGNDQTSVALLFGFRFGP